MSDEINEHLTRQRRELWMLLDHIDTLDDSCRDNDEAFRNLVREHQKKRFAIWNPQIDAEVATFQQRVHDWVTEVFGDESLRNVQERAMRFIEEAIELTQVCEVPQERVHRMVNYVFSRSVGEAQQEMGGCLVTLYALSSCLNVDAEEALETELTRIQTPEAKARIRQRQNEKHEARLAEHKA